MRNQWQKILPTIQRWAKIDTVKKGISTLSLVLSPHFSTWRASPNICSSERLSKAQGDIIECLGAQCCTLKKSRFHKLSESFDWITAVQTWRIVYCCIQEPFHAAGHQSIFFAYFLNEMGTITINYEGEGVSLFTKSRLMILKCRYQDLFHFRAVTHWIGWRCASLLSVIYISVGGHNNVLKHFPINTLHTMPLMTP